MTSVARRTDDRLSYTDQLLFLGQRATDQELVMQAVWIYQHAVDYDGLRRFHGNFGYGLFGRLIERSPLPFGRHRWVSSLGPSTEMDIATPRPRTELSDWVDECAQAPIDPEYGPGWRLKVLPMTDGSTAVSLVMSHCLADGVGAVQTIVDGIKGNRRSFVYPQAHSRTRSRAVASDLLATARDIPEIARTLRAAAKQAVRRRREIFRPTGSKSSAGGFAGDESTVVSPAITVYVDLDDWDACADSLGGTSYALVAALAAKFGERTGRRRARDGAVTLNIPISDRVPDDTRANAATIATVVVDSATVTEDLTATRAAIKQALKALKDEPDETLELLPLTPFIPKRMVKHGSQVVFGFEDLPISCSNLGDVDPMFARIDGTDADYLMLRGVDRHVTRDYLESRGGLLTVLAGRIGGKISITVVGYQPGVDNTKSRLRELAVQTLADFNLTGVID
jgi:Wax ester synthase-like Acyl-CoA acyltransferase domain